MTLKNLVDRIEDRFALMATLAIVGTTLATMSTLLLG